MTGYNRMFTLTFHSSIHVGISLFLELRTKPRRVMSERREAPVRREWQPGRKLYERQSPADED